MQSLLPYLFVVQRYLYIYGDLLMEKKKIAGVIVAAAAFAFISAPMATSTFAKAKVAKIKCYGVNKCKGHSACKTAQNACKHQNACKGHGFRMESHKKCEKMGGNTEET